MGGVSTGGLARDFTGTRETAAGDRVKFEGELARMTTRGIGKGNAWQRHE
jgi:hypothetical protein